MTFTAALSAALLSCSDRNGAEREEMRFSLCLPVSCFTSVHGDARRRVIGDPGTTEQFLLPEYAYIFVFKRTGSEWRKAVVIERHLSEGDWVKERYSGSLRSEGDSVYRYNNDTVLFLTDGRYEGRVYAVMSAEPLTFNRSLNSITTLDDLLGLKIDVSSSTMQQGLQHIYSTPYNYNLESTGRYYGSFSTFSEFASTVNLMLYHIAAKVDLQWNVAEDMRINLDDPSAAVRLTCLEARNLFNGQCYAFKPMENVVASMPESGYSITDIVTPSSEGLWWEGRYYFYTIPFTVSGTPGYFPVQLRMKTNNTAGEGYRLTLNQPIDSSEPFVPWIRGSINITEPLGNTTAVKTIGD